MIDTPASFYCPCPSCGVSTAATGTTGGVFDGSVKCGTIWPCGVTGGVAMACGGAMLPPCGGPKGCTDGVVDTGAGVNA